MDKNATETLPVQAGYETTDVHVPGVWLAGLGLALGCIVVMLLMVLMFDMLQRHADEANRATVSETVTESVSTSVQSFPAPRLQVRPEDDLAALRAREDEELNHYGWIDKKAGVVRIPIGRAMDLIMERGLPYREEPGAPMPTRTVLEIQQARPSDWQTTPQTK